VASHAQAVRGGEEVLAPAANSDRLSYLVAVVFFMVGWDDPPPSLALLIYAGLRVWVVQLAVTVPMFAALWLACRLLLPRLGASPPGVARMFFWTSLIGSPLALKFLLSI